MGRDRKNEDRTEHWTKMLRPTMETPAWRALSPLAQALYPWIKFEWKGPQANNNGRISLPVRDAAQRMGRDKDAVGRAFHDLQAKGFLVLREHGRMGVEGKGTPPTYEITELALPGEHSGRKLYADWQPGHDFAVRAHTTSNPKGHNGKNKTLSPEKGQVVPLRGTKKP
jgi:hypothetical protein